jgi:hypothetical protein
MTKRIYGFLFSAAMLFSAPALATQSVITDASAGACSAGGGNHGTGTCTISSVTAFANTETVTFTATSSGPLASFTTSGSVSGALTTVISGSLAAVTTSSGFPVFAVTLSDGGTAYSIGDTFSVATTAGTELKKTTFDLFTLAQICSNGCSAGASLTATNLSGTNTGDVTIGSFGASPTANGLSLSSQVITLQPADSTRPGAVSASAQTFGGAKTFSSDATVTGVLSTLKGSDYSTTGTSNNVSTASLSLFRYTGAGTATITGFANGSDGKLLRLINASSSKVTINDQDAGSTAANRITTGVGAALVLLPGGALNLIYDTTASLWRVVGAPGANGGWTAYTPTLSGFGTTSNVSFFYRRNGQNMQVRGSFTAGTTAGTAAQMTFPAGFTPDTTFITGTFPMVGWGISPQTNTMLALYYGDATHANFINNASQTNGSQVATSATSISVMLEYPVQ